MASPPPTGGRRPGPRQFSGRQVIWAGLIGGVGGLLFGLFLRTIVERTPAQLPSYGLFWLVVMLAAMGCLSAMAVESVRQLQVSNPNPAYHRLQQQRERLARERQRRRADPQ